MPEPEKIIELDVEQLMDIIHRRIDAQPDAKLIISRIETIKRCADGISEPLTFSNDPMSRAKGLLYKCLMRVFKSNFERQRIFNHDVLHTLQLIAEDMHRVQRILPASVDSQTTPNQTKQ